ncbi:hypothetical protein GGR54DRAFT_606408 [Hypoxylon sp. NC1633]|nr:hypothetical protein GGR54DRAFT_606408 [Hypoxylon sp. NC1633]
MADRTFVADHSEWETVEDTAPSTSPQAQHRRAEASWWAKFVGYISGAARTNPTEAQDGREESGPPFTWEMIVASVARDQQSETAPSASQAEDSSQATSGHRGFDRPGRPASRILDALPRNPFGRIVPRISGDMYQEIRQYVERTEWVDVNGNLVNINITCSLCLDKKLRVGQRPPREEFETALLNPDYDAVADSEVIQVFPCGHYFGRDCVLDWMSEMVRMRRSAITCPICRFEMVHPECGHIAYPLGVLMGDFTIGTSVERQIIPLPPTIPEGGQVAASCPSCSGYLNISEW